ncbi:wall-associated receptor kinase-like 8 [Cornus florida]|uniref:wall-associated receptor kinase-like 8 n=1 Tax=Cornus florida TaxID=4283 RepID=UPI0028A15A61|nr:wall-associated receptor kinase-like 8 [Cornus florida]
MVIQLMQQITLLFLLIGASLARPGCQDRCGNVIIPYPFGIGANCSADESLEINCNHSFTPPKPLITGINLEVLEISLSESAVLVNNPVISSNCENRTNNQDAYLNGPFSFSDTNNQFTAMGCDNLALITRQGMVIGGCMSLCNVTTRDTTCYGLNCCQTTIPPFLKFINASFRSIDSNSDNKGCKYAFMVDQEWFTNLTDPFAVQEMEKVPAMLNWYTIGTCQTFGVYNSSVPNSLLCGTNASCSSTSNQSSSYRCQCDLGYKGNPYLPDECQGV